MSIGVDTVTTVTLKSCPDYLPRVRRIMACLADSVGMDASEKDEAALALSEACANAIRHGSPNGMEDSVLITLKTSGSTITADVTDSGAAASIPDASNEPHAGLGVRLMRSLADTVQFIRHTTGLTVRLTKRARGRRARRLNTRSFPAAHRN